jgi:hypothetical protein
MKKLASLSIALLAALVLAGPVMAGDAEAVTMEGTVQCGKCVMHEEGLDKCQNVLVVMEDGAESHYWLAANETNSEYGEVCMKSRTVRVTGMVEEKDGHVWIVASEMVAVEEEG